MKHCFLLVLCLSSIGAICGEAEWLPTPLGWIKADGSASCSLRTTVEKGKTGVLVEMNSRDLGKKEWTLIDAPTAGVAFPLNKGGIVVTAPGEVAAGHSFRKRFESKVNVTQEGRNAPKFKNAQQGFVAYSERLQIVSQAGAKPTPLSEQPGDYFAAAPSADGKSVIAAVYRENHFHLVILDLESPYETLFATSSSTAPASDMGEMLYLNPVLQADGKKAWFASKDGPSRFGIATATVGEKRATIVIKKAGADCWQPSPSPDGSMIAYVVSANGWEAGMGKPGDEIWTAKSDGSGAKCLIKPGKNETANHPRYAADGKTLMYTLTSRAADSAKTAPGFVGPAQRSIDKHSLMSISMDGGEPKALIEDIKSLIEK